MAVTRKTTAVKTAPRLSKATKVAPVIHVSVPSSAAGDLSKMQQITKNVLGRLGCLACHSGFDLRFINEKIFVFNEKGETLIR